jgi:hypothetical protein
MNNDDMNKDQRGEAEVMWLFAVFMSLAIALAI